MSEKKPLSVEQQFQSLRIDLAQMQQKITWMQTRGGFTDAKTHSMRAQRLEDRMDRLEIQMTAALDAIAFMTELLGEHLKDRHDANLDRDDDIDVASWRRIRRRLRDLAEKLGLMEKRRATTQVRQSENRLRPAVSA